MSEVRAGKAFVEITAEPNVGAGIRAAAAQIQSGMSSMSFPAPNLMQMLTGQKPAGRLNLPNLPPLASSDIYGPGSKMWSSARPSRAAAVGDSLGMVNAAAGMLGVGLGAAALANFITATAQESHELQNMARGLRMTTESLDKFQALGKTVGVSTELIAHASRKLTENIGRGQMGGSQAGTFASLGLDVNELAKGDRVSQLTAVAKAIQQIGDESRRAAIEVQLLGKSGAELDVALEEIASGGLERVKTMSAEARIRMAMLDESWGGLKRGAAELISGIMGVGDVLGANLAGTRTETEMRKLNEEMQEQLDKQRRILALKQEQKRIESTPMSAGPGLEQGSREAQRLILETMVQTALLRSMAGGINNIAGAGGPIF